MEDFRHIRGDGSSVPCTLSALSVIMEFDLVVRVTDDGNVSDEDIPDSVGLWAPSLFEGDLDQHPDHAGWSLFTQGYTGQYGYNGPIMHNSEYIDGRLARDILAQPGYYVALVSDYGCTDDCVENCGRDHADGWAVAFKPVEG